MTAPTTTNGKGNIDQVRELLEDAGSALLDRVESDQLDPYPTPQASGEYQTTMFVDQIGDLITYLATNPELQDQVPCFMGGTAIGKTASIQAGIKEAARVMGRSLVDELGNTTFHEVHVSQLGPVDALGVPREDGRRRTVWYPPRMWPLVSATGGHEEAYQRFLQDYAATGRADWSIMSSFPLYAFFFDEVTNPSSPQIVHQLFSIWYGRYVADHKLVNDTFIALAGNRVTDRTGSIPLAASATTRLAMIEVLPRLSGWLRAYAMKPVFWGGEEFTREHPLVIAYLDRNPHDFAPEPGNITSMQPFANPRGWSFVSRVLYAYDRNPAIPEEILRAKIAGRIGDAVAAKFWAFRKYWREVPNVNKMLNSPAKPGESFGWLPERWPDRIDLLVLVATQMVTKLNEQNAKRFMAFLLDDTKFSPEVATVTLKMLRPAGKLQKLAQIWATEAFSTWARTHARIAL